MEVSVTLMYRESGSSAIDEFCFSCVIDNVGRLINCLRHQYKWHIVDIQVGVIKQ